MIDHARVTAQNHAFTYDERIKVESATQAVCDLALRFGESVHDEEAMMSRPFGVALLIAGIDELGPQLYALEFWCYFRDFADLNCPYPSRFHTDPSGTFIRYEAKAIGSGSEAAQQELQDKWHKVRSCSYSCESDSALSLCIYIANDVEGSTDIDSASVEASDGGEAGPTQCATGSGMAHLSS
jgi:20S proteasome alpha/beta subunit